MITVTVTKNNDIITGFEISGHSGYAEEGSDIVCAAVSALSINTVNSVECLTDDLIICSEPDACEGSLIFSVSEPSEKTVLLFDSLECGLKSIVESYGKKFLKIVYNEK